MMVHHGSKYLSGQMSSYQHQGAAGLIILRSCQQKAKSLKERGVPEGLQCIWYHKGTLGRAVYGNHAMECGIGEERDDQDAGELG